MTRVECAKCHGTGEFAGMPRHGVRVDWRPERLCNYCDGLGWVEVAARPGRLLAALLAVLTLVAVILVALPDRAEGQTWIEPPALEWNDQGQLHVTGRWAALAWCESRGDPQADSGAGDYGIVQFRAATWDAVARWRGRLWLVGVNPASVSVRRQFAQAWALARMPGGGMQHWSCAPAFWGGQPSRVAVVGVTRPVPPELTCRARWCTGGAR